MGAVSPKGLAHNPSPSQTGKLIHLLTTSRRKWPLKTVSVKKHCVLVKEPTCFHGGGGVTEASNSRLPLF